jgi:hypothetical protein
MSVADFGVQVCITFRSVDSEKIRLTKITCGLLDAWLSDFSALLEGGVTGFQIRPLIVTRAIVPLIRG